MKEEEESKSCPYIMTRCHADKRAGMGVLLSYKGFKVVDLFKYWYYNYLLF